MQSSGLASRSGALGCANTGYNLSALPGLAELWQDTQGDGRVCVAVLDGPVQLEHPSFHNLNPTVIQTAVSAVANDTIACRHGTHVASVLFGQPGGPVQGLVPCCRALFVPIFGSGASDGVRPCSQIDLARAIAEAVRHGAHIINISGGEFSADESASPLLAATVEECVRRDVLIVSAAGNQGCACLHIPAALSSVLAVGAMDGQGQPLPGSNWGEAYLSHGILAPGERIAGAKPGGGVVLQTGTSCAAAIVSGIAALLLSRQWQRGQTPSPRRVGEALLRTARGCEEQPISDCRRLLAGRLNVQGAVSYLTKGILPMSEVNVDSSREATSGALPNAAEPMRATPASNGQVQPSACGCASAAEPRFVYALGQVGYDLVNETRLDSIAQHMAGALKVPVDRHLAFDPQQVLAYLQANAFAAASFEWTLMLDGAPVYVIRPQGPFAGDMYGELREALDEQLQKKVDRVAVAGVLSGTAKLLMGQSVPVIAPELRGFYSWNTGALVDAATAPAPPAGATQQDLDAYALKREKVHNWLEHIYHALRNLGVLPQDRAVNFAASNALQMGEIYESALNEKLEFDSIKATPSPLCRPGSDCWDLEIYFFYPERQVQTVRKVWRYTVDVSDAVPATIGPVRSWYTR